MTAQKLADVGLGTVQQDVHIVVAGLPWVLEQVAGTLLEDRCQFVAQGIEGLSQRRTPGLIPTRAPAIAAAIRPPSLNAMDAAPGSIFKDLHIVSRRMLGQIPSIAGNIGKVLGLDLIQGVGERHLPERMMVSVRFTVRGNVDRKSTRLNSS